MPDIYSLKEVAEALGIAQPTLKYHIYTSKFYAGFGRVIGNSMAFSQADLDAMLEKSKTMPHSGEPEKQIDGVSVYQIAYEMREKGETFDAIAKALGYKTGGGAYRAVQKYAARLKAKPKKPRAKKAAPVTPP